MTHTCICKLTIIGSYNGVSPEQRKAIIWQNAGIWLTGPLGTNFSEILIEIQTFECIVCELAAILFRPLYVNDDWLIQENMDVSVGGWVWHTHFINNHNIKNTWDSISSKDSISRYSDCLKDKIMVRSSFHYNGNVYGCKMASVHWNCFQDMI